MFLADREEIKARAGTACRAPTEIHYNLRARRNELSAKKKNNRAKATATAEATSQWATSRVQERRAALSRTIPRNANMAPATSRKSCFRARQKRWKPPWRGAAAVELAAEDMSASYRKTWGEIRRE